MDGNPPATPSSGRFVRFIFITAMIINAIFGIFFENLFPYGKQEILTNCLSVFFTILFLIYEERKMKKFERAYLRLKVLENMPLEIFELWRIVPATASEEKDMFLVYAKDENGIEYVFKCGKEQFENKKIPEVPLYVSHEKTFNIRNREKQTLVKDILIQTQGFEGKEV